MTGDEHKKIEHGPYRTGLASEVREYVSGLPRRQLFSAPQVARALGHKTSRVREVFRDMLRRGEIERVRPRMYWYLGAETLGKRAGWVKPRVVRAMHTRGAFCTREIAVLTDVRKNTVRRIILRLIESGDVERIGKQKSPRGDREYIYGVRNLDGFFLKYICSSAWKKRVRDRDRVRVRETCPGNTKGRGEDGGEKKETDA